MTLLIDAAPLVAAADQADRWGPAVRRVIRDAAGPLVVPAPVTAEVDHLLGVRLGRPSRLAFLLDLANDRFRVESLDVGVTLAPLNWSASTPTSTWDWRTHP